TCEPHSRPAAPVFGVGPRAHVLKLATLCEEHLIGRLAAQPRLKRAQKGKAFDVVCDQHRSYDPGTPPAGLRNAETFVRDHHHSPTMNATLARSRDTVALPSGPSTISRSPLTTPR